MTAGNFAIFEASSEEVANRNLHAWVGLAIPVHPQNQLAQMKRTWRVDRKPDVPDGTGARYVREGDCGVGLYFDPVCIAARAIGA